ncbi:MAG: acetoacetyl-CoA reductase [Gammaproteobacteria bacterium]|nr:acetoacetyl-CoA reductase [Gammaproteobacteria bacterium]
MSKRVALVTGGIGGIGTAICRRLASEGMTVVANYLPALKEEADAWQQAEREKGFEFALASGDVADFEDSRRMVQALEAEVGAVDVLVNCAGITRDKSFRKMEPEQWRAVIETNLFSVFNVSKQVVEGMTSRGWGRIVNISSVNGQQGQFGQTNYSAAKAGVHGFTMALARETAAKGVTVNTVSPGYVETAMTADMGEEILAQIVASVPVGRMGRPDEVAACVAFLASEDAAYITGTDLSVNGGFRMG